MSHTKQLVVVGPFPLAPQNVFAYWRLVRILNNTNKDDLEVIDTFCVILSLYIYRPTYFMGVCM